MLSCNIFLGHSAKAQSKAGLEVRLKCLLWFKGIFLLDNVTATMINTLNNDYLYYLFIFYFIMMIIIIFLKVKT